MIKISRLFSTNGISSVDFNSETTSVYGIIAYNDFHALIVLIVIIEYQNRDFPVPDVDAKCAVSHLIVRFVN